MKITCLRGAARARRRSAGPRLAASDLGRLAAVRVLRALALLGLAMTFLGGCSSRVPRPSDFGEGVERLAAGELQAAEAAFERALAEDPTRERARFNLAFSRDLLAQDLLGGAERARRRAIRAATVDTAAGRNSASRSRREAEALSGQAARKLQAARAGYEALLDDPVVGLRAGINLSAMDFESGEAARATAARARLLELAERHPEVAELPLALAARALLDGRADAVAGHLRPLFERDPDHGEGLLLSGEAALQLGETVAARSALERGLARLPEALRPRVSLLALARQEERWDDAEVMARDGLYLHADAPALHRELGLALVQRHAYAEAIGHLAEAMRLVETRAGVGPAVQRIQLLKDLTVANAGLAKQLEQEDG